VRKRALQKRRESPERREDSSLAGENMSSAAADGEPRTAPSCKRRGMEETRTAGVRDRRDEGDEVKDAEDARPLLV
ncbi:MAG TPA: hypothetical protein VKA45_14695, partial [Gaiellaceae bacterium]|nr:hypothetical protein [Gaiellaceae bacterium]